MDWKALIGKALGGQVISEKFDRENNDFDVKVFYPATDPMVYNWTLIRRIDFENHTVYGRVSLAQLTRFIDDQKKEFHKALEELNA